MKDFRHDTNRNFKNMADKHGNISKEPKEFRDCEGFFGCVSFGIPEKNNQPLRSSTGDRIELEIKRALKTKQLHEPIT